MAIVRLSPEIVKGIFLEIASKKYKSKKASGLRGLSRSRWPSYLWRVASLHCPFPFQKVGQI
jgi:hypothetical protein